MDESFKPQERIRKKSDFFHLYRKGKRYRGKYFTLVYLSNALGFSRMAVVAGRKLGNAVQRNRAKRRMRTLFRRNKELLKTPLDLIIIPRTAIHEAGWKSLEDEYRMSLETIQAGRRNQ